MFRGIEKMSVEVFIILLTAAAGAIIVAAELAVIKVAEWIFKAVMRKVRNKKRKQF